MTFSRHTLPKMLAPSRFFTRFTEAEQVTTSLIGVVTKPVWSGKDGKYYPRLEAITLFIRPHLFIFDLRK